MLTFSCKTRGFCPSCHAKRVEEWGEWVRESLLLDVPHPQVVLTIPKTLRIFFKYRRRLLGELCRAAVKTLTIYFEALAGERLVPGVIVAIQTFGDRINFHAHLHLLVTEGGVDKAGRTGFLARIVEEELPRLPSKGWAETIRKVYEVDPLVCSRRGGRMKVVAFLTEPAVVDRIIRHLELTFAAEKPPPAHAFEQAALLAAEESGKYE